MGHLHNLVMLPVEIVGNEGYLLVKLIKGVATHSPGEENRHTVSGGGV